MPLRYEGHQRDILLSRIRIGIAVESYEFKQRGIYYSIDRRMSSDGASIPYVQTWIYLGRASDLCTGPSTCFVGTELVFEKISDSEGLGVAFPSERIAIQDADSAREKMFEWKLFVDACVTWQSTSDRPNLVWPIWSSPNNERRRLVVGHQPSVSGDACGFDERCEIVEFIGPIDGAVIERIKHCPMLRKVVVRESAMANDYSIGLLADLPHIDSISIRGRRVTDTGIKRFAHWPALCEADLRCTSISDATVEMLSASCDLRILALDGTRITDAAYKWIARMMRLNAISVEQTATTDLGARQLVDFPELVVVNLSKTQLSDQGLSSIVDLDRLCSLLLSWTKISDSGLRLLEACKSLQELWLRSTNVSWRGIRAFAEVNPNCHLMR